MGEWTPADAAGLTAGSRIAGYLLEQQVGQGPAGTVFRALDEQRDQWVAVKVIRPPLAADQAFASRLIREAQAAAAVGEPHILPAWEASQASGKLFVAMPYLRGGDARSLVRREGPLIPQRVTEIVWRLASALDAVHAAGLVHGDVKPGNVLVEARPGQPDLVYVSDFGQGRGAAPAPLLAGTAPASAALDCIAPEQAAGQQGDGRADQYALACVAFELMTAVPAFRHDEPALAARPDAPRTASVRPGLPSAVDIVLGRALAQVVAYRYGSCREFADALHAAFWPGSSPPRPVTGGPAAIPVPRGAPAAPDLVPGVPAAAAAGGAAAAAGGAAPPGTAPPGALPAGAAVAGAVPGSPFADGPGAVPGGALLSSPGPGPGLPATAVPGPNGPPASPPGASPPGREPWLVPGRPRRFRAAPVAVAVAVVVIVAGLVAGLLVVLGGHAAAKPTALHISATTGTKPEGGDVWTVYASGNLARARIHGSLTGAVSGEVARLYAQPFPFSGPPARVGSPVRLHPHGQADTASYSFKATPTLATRYRVEVFQSSSAKTALARTAATTVYVSSGFSPASSATPSPACRRPVCQVTISGDVLIPASAMSTEFAKPVQAYFGLNLSGSATAPQPAALELGAGAPRVSTKLISPSEYQITVTFTFSIGKTGGFSWAWNACIKDTEAADGMGLPGSHGCGDKNVPAQVNYLG